MRSTFLAKPQEIKRDWYIVDATDVPLGRLSSVVATVLRGKNKPTFTPSVDTGDYVIVVNADLVRLTGKKVTDKYYYHHSGFPGGLKARQAGDLRENNPKKLIELAVQGMLPKNTLGRAQGLKLHVYASGEKVGQTAQKPRELDIKDLL
ncbi:50S ribosomal protein L13 [Oenococcus kitaharae]|uniref:Large ribosomal subunit protein uL13 n=1 Tax=Oenococcus kitaharae DSM 17330 TaxID=1045004 RepID=G9WI43_9LACO|nr:50S ribosomal protein L13 [Oenococcus kitaharae]EHN59165.1 LSU ribosomal protein L13p (L13Ae) [Oenococcus kitaharae DSM 17330]MCV3297091.1 50S ribosomal protein L13 [Oenococcus kitaharae]OEY81959.1 50S ribosomal protein L13 [Oenococcus kitaharae]OEY82330.1 50S ribosomal protein L13 [Oenococcus kitaharae]OEY82736.1 50S ribosomal protein L13 [Oenococcus kitaharae]